MNALASPIVVPLAQATLLLALAWLAHALLRGGHPLWRVALWRSVLVAIVLLPLVSALRVPRIAIPAPLRSVLTEAAARAPEGERAALPTQIGEATSSSAAMPSLGGTREGIDVAARRAAGAPRRVEPPWWTVVPWPPLLLTLWAFGAAWEIVRLVRLRGQLAQLVRAASPAEPVIQSLAARLQDEVGIRGAVRVQISSEIAAPFLCGVFRPTILLPRGMAEALHGEELAALLTHELAHQRRRDLPWCTAWLALRAALWFHPLLWRVPATHLRACEEEADRLAAQRLYGTRGYAQLLAQLALRVLGRPTPDSPLALNATSHLAQRLVRLVDNTARRWTTAHALATAALVAALFVVSAGWHFAQTASIATPSPIATATMKFSVEDEAGAPLAGATVKPIGLRASEERLKSTGYGWVPERHGPATKVGTGSDGVADVTYPVFIVTTERIRTGSISFQVDHPEFAPAWIRDQPVDGAGKPAQLTRGIRLRVSAHAGANRERVREIRPILLTDLLAVPPEEWRSDADGARTYRRLNRGKHFLIVAGRLASGEVGYSNGVAFFGEQRDAHEYDVELKPGVRVEGRLDAAVARPIRNGWVQLSVHDDEANTRQLPPGLPRSRLSDNTGFWWSYRPLNPDGSFVFESVPPGELKVIAYGDGFVSSNGPAEEAPRPPGMPSRPPRPATRSVPQSFAPAIPTTALEIKTERTATLRVVIEADGRGVPDAKVHVWPNMIQMPRGSRLFGAGGISDETGFRPLPPLPTGGYSVATDAGGVAVLKDVPVFTSSLAVEHPTLEVPLREPESGSNVPKQFRPPPNRYVQFALQAGETTTVKTNLQPKGREFAGGAP